MRLSKVQVETIEYCKRQIDEARGYDEIALKKISLQSQHYKQIQDAKEGIVYTQGGNCTSRTLKALEKQGLLKILEDNSGIGCGAGAFPSKVQLLNY
ncbi:hypothetical protein SAMN02910358_01735 [Lachnospiraceae bacterium XBB1006]|nr:hypothetical protein SAMN02910358_01735 [Lachnospiraceae bacterium XBB1006]